MEELLLLLRTPLDLLEELLLLRMPLDLLEVLRLETELLLLLELELLDPELTREEELLRPVEALPRRVVALRLFERVPSIGTLSTLLLLFSVLVSVTRPLVELLVVPLVGRPEVVTVVPGRVDDAPPVLPTAPPLPAELLAPEICVEPRSVVRPPSRSL